MPRYERSADSSTARERTTHSGRSPLLAGLIQRLLLGRGKQVPQEAAAPDLPSPEPEVVSPTVEIKSYAEGETLGRQYSIGLPPVADIARVLPEMLDRDPSAILTKVEGMDIDLLHQQAKALQEAETVIFDALSLGGLGDSIQVLRYAIIAARHFPDKEFFIEVHPQILEIYEIDRELLNLPPKVKLIQRDDRIEYNPSTTFLFNSQKTPGRWYIEPLDLTEDRVAWDFPIDINPIVDTLGLKRSGNSIEEDTPFILTDFQYVSWFIGLGIPLTQDDLQSPELSFLRSPSKGGHKDYDLVIAPDAKERSVGGKSEKSLSIEDWEKIFIHLKQANPEAQIGIIRGVAHPDYCESIFAAAQRAGLRVKEEITRSLTEVINVLERTSVFVGMDSGTTHLANEAAIANQDLTVRELYMFNAINPDYPINRYGIRGLGQRGEIFRFVRRDKQPIGANVAEATSDIAEFIAA